MIGYDRRTMAKAFMFLALTGLSAVSGFQSHSLQSVASGLGARHRTAGGGRSSVRMMAADASAAVAPATGPSALVLGWFGATQNELDFVAKIYRKKGYEDVVVKDSPIATCSKPRGWYRAVKSMAFGQNREGDAAVDSHPLSRHFDRVHVMSGGFLNLYLQKLGGASLTFDTLVLDSTPILPKPTSFTRFARAYMATMSKPVSLIPKLVPLPLHLAYVYLRWSLSSAYIWARHFFSQLTGGKGAGAQVLGRLAPYAVTFRYAKVVENCVGTVFGGARPAGSAPLKALFVTNPADPYLSYTDVQATMKQAEALGCQVQEVPVPTDHVKAVFRKPAAIFTGPAALPSKKDDEQAKAE